MTCFSFPFMALLCIVGVISNTLRPGETLMMSVCHTPVLRSYLPRLLCPCNTLVHTIVPFLSSPSSHMAPVTHGSCHHDGPQPVQKQSCLAGGSCRAHGCVLIVGNLWKGFTHAEAKVFVGMPAELCFKDNAREAGSIAGHKHIHAITSTQHKPAHPYTPHTPAPTPPDSHAHTGTTLARQF